MNWPSRLYPLLRKAIPAFILVAGVGISYFAFREARHFDDERVKTSLELRASLRTRDIESKILDATVPVESLATFVANQKQLDPEEFYDFAVTARGNDPIVRLTWAPLVSNERRADFEAEVRRTDANPNYAISDLDANGRLIPAGVRDEYLPIRFEQTFAGTPSLMGFDRLAEPLRRAATERARDTGTPVFTGLLPPEPEEDRKISSRVVLAWPVYRRGSAPLVVAERRTAIQGFVTGSFSIDDMFAFVLHNTPALVENLTLFIGAPDRPLGEPAVHYSNVSGKIETGGASSTDSDPGGLRLTNSFYQLGQNWTLVSDFPVNTVAELRSPAPWGYLGIGLALTLWLATYAVFQQRRQSAVETLVAERTRDLYDLTDRMSAIVESSPLPTIVQDDDSRVTFWNRAAERVFGYSAHEVIGVKHPLVPPGGEAEHYAAIGRMRNGEIIQGQEFLRQRKDGSTVEIASSAAAFRNSQGAVQGFIFTAEDITERNRHEAAEREITERLRAIVESSNDAIISKTLDGIVTSWNSAAARIFGYSAEEMIGRHISMLTPPGHEELIEILEKIGRGERIEHYETQRRHKNGSILDISITVSPIRDARGKIIGASKVAHDITQAKEAAAAIRKQEELYRATYQQALVGIALVDRDFRYVHVNDCLAASSGLKAVDMVGRRVVEVVPDIWDEIEPILRRVIGSGKAVTNIEVVGLAPTASGRIRHELISYQPVMIFGEIVGVSVTAIDITDLKTAEAELRRSREHLARVQSVARIGSIEIDLVSQEATWSEEMFLLLGIDCKTSMPGVDAFAGAIHPGDRSIVRDLSARGRRGENTEPCEFRVVRSDGTIRWLYHIAAIVRDADGQPIQHVATMYDITDRKAAEDALRKSEEHLARVQRVARIGSADIDLVTQESVWSEELYVILGIEAGGIGTDFHSFMTLIHPDDRALVGELSVTGRKGEHVPASEFRVVRPDGEVRWVYRQADFTRDAAGQPTRLIATMYDITERKVAEEALQQSKEHLAQAQRVGNIGSAEIDLRTGKVFWSEQTYRLFGLDPDTTAPNLTTFLSVIPPQDRERDRQLAERIRLGHGVDAFEYRIIRPDGLERWILRTTEIVRNRDGVPTLAMTLLQDVTDRRRLVDDLRRSQEHLARVQSVARISSTEVDLETGEVTWSDEVYRMLGVDQGKVTPSVDSFAAAIHLDDRASMRDVSLKGRRGEEVQPTEFRMIGLDRAIRWFYRKAGFIRDTVGRPTRLIATMYEITERKAAEAARLASEEQYRLTFDMAPVGIAHVSLDGQFLVVNDMLCAMFGAARDQMLSANYRMFTHPDDVDKSDQYIRRMILGAEPIVTWEKRFVRGDGSIMWCHLTSTLDRDESGQVTHFITVYENITARKDAEARRSQLEEQLQQSQKMEAVGRLTGGVAHDFNNLLTVILINLELVLERVTNDPRLKRQIESALGAGQRGADLTQRLLAFSRRQPLAPVVVDVNKRTAELVPLLARTIGETITVKQTLSSSLWSAVVDPSQFDSAIMNLAVNARDAMPNGGRLEIKTDNIEVDDAYAERRLGLAVGRYIRVSVTDTGTGMPPEVAEKAFEPFFTTKEVGKGTGLGLSMIYGFTKQSGGHASIYSEVGVGTTVTLLLPADPQEQTEDIGPAPTEAFRTVGSETILVVEDDPEVRLAAVSLLDALGYQTLEAGTVREGLALFAANPHIDLVLTDVILPEGDDGAELARSARALRPDAKILFMSGYTEDIVMHDGRLDAGVVLLQKPFTRAQLAEKVRAAIDGVSPVLVS